MSASFTEGFTKVSASTLERLARNYLPGHAKATAKKIQMKHFERRLFDKKKSYPLGEKALKRMDQFIRSKIRE